MEQLEVLDVLIIWLLETCKCLVCMWDVFILFQDNKHIIYTKKMTQKTKIIDRWNCNLCFLFQNHHSMCIRAEKIQMLHSFQLKLKIKWRNRTIANRKLRYRPKMKVCFFFAMKMRDFLRWNWTRNYLKINHLQEAITLSYNKINRAGDNSFQNRIFHCQLAMSTGNPVNVLDRIVVEVLIFIANI